MVGFNKNQLDKLLKMAKELEVNKDVIVTSACVVTESVNDSVKRETIVKGSRPPLGTYGHVYVEPLVKVTRTRSIKISNLAHVDMGALLELVAGGVLTGTDIVAEPHPIIIAAGLLLMIRSFTRSMTVEFSEREASVFWGLIQSCDKKKVAELDTIVEQTNIVRKGVGLNPLSEKLIRESLKFLESIKSISRVKGKIDTWCIRERWSTSRMSSRYDRGTGLDHFHWM